MISFSSPCGTSILASNSLDPVLICCDLFGQDAKEETQELELDLKELDDISADLSTYFCEEDKTFKLDDCIKIFNTFCEKFKKAIQVCQTN